jgi:hypothetical protein
MISILFLFIPLFILPIEIHHHSTDDVIIMDDHLDQKVTFAEMMKESYNIADIESSRPRPLTLRQRCSNNKVPLIAAGATITSALIAGSVALIVHFTQPG